MYSQAEVSISNLLICPYCNSQDSINHKLIYQNQSLECPNCKKKYSSIENVPILTNEHSQLKNEDPSKRQNFYNTHYYHRSRTKDIQSAYLLAERRIVANFVKEHNINGLCLEIGCGTGIFADMAPNYLGMDYSFSAVFAEGFSNYNRIVASAESIPLQDQSAQLVISFNTLEHIPDPKLAFQEIDRVLMPNGYAILKPAWHCTKYNTELLPIKEYNQLNLEQKLRKFLLPLFKSKIFKFLTRIPARLLRRITYHLFYSQSSTKLQYRKLIPYLGDDVFIADCDATADIDFHEGLLYFESRDYKILSHKTLSHRLLAGNDILIVQKTKNKR